MASYGWNPKNVISMGDITAAADNPAKPVPMPAPSPASMYIVIANTIAAFSSCFISKCVHAATRIADKNRGRNFALY
jgi:hypothetical protein